MPLHQPLPHESGLKHASGEALYVDDLPAPPGLLVGVVVGSVHAHARLTSCDASAARAVPGVHAVLTARDIPGRNEVGAVVHDEPLLADGEVHCVGQAVALVVGESYAACRAGAARLALGWEPLPAVLTLEAAIAGGHFLSEPHTLRRGDVEAALAAAPLRFSGVVESGAQDHFYLETHAALAVPEEGDALRIQSSTQHPAEVQAIVAHVLGWHRHQVVVEVPRLGGGFGGKETQAAHFAALAALAAVRTRRPVKLWLDRDQDIAQTGKRHPFHTRFEAGFESDGRLVALKAALFSDGGWANDLSRAILDRALFHVDNAYFVPAVEVTGRACRTNLPSNTAFRGFGGPQGMLVVEEVMSRAAERLGLDPAAVRERNYYGAPPRDQTPYHQTVTDSRLARVHRELLASADYERRRAEIERHNRASTHLKRGIAFTPVKFGISFTTSFLNQAGALALLYADGTLQVNHGGIEMGQGLHTKMLAICRDALGLSADRLRVMTTATDKVPNTSATAASTGSDLNGQALLQACEELRERLRPVAQRLLQASDAEARALAFAGDAVRLGAKAVPLAEVAQAAYLAQVPLFAAGFYRTPGIHYDRAAGSGHPFHYYSYGAAVTEVEVSALTGEHRLLRVDLLHDVGASLVPSIDRGQIEGAFVQGWGWLTCEELRFDGNGVLTTHSPDTYKIPSAGDVPRDFRVQLLSNAPQAGVVHGSKAVGEPPLMLALSAVGALRHAVAAYGPPRREVRLRIPCTPEAVLFAIEDARAAGG